MSCAVESANGDEIELAAVPFQRPLAEAIAGALRKQLAELGKNVVVTVATRNPQEKRPTH